MTAINRDYYLMHKDIPVCLMEISDDGVLSRVRRNETAAEHFPLGADIWKDHRTYRG